MVELTYSFLVECWGLAQLDHRLHISTSKGYQDSTKRNLVSQINRYLQFCIQFGLMPFPADAIQMRRYAQFLSESVKAIATVQNYMSAVRTYHYLVGANPPPRTSDCFMLNQTLRGLRLVMARPVRQAEPITPELLCQMHQFVNIKNQQQLVAWVAILLGFHMMLRKSNLVPEGQFQPGKQLARRSITVGEGLLLVDIEWSKTLQYKQKKLIIPLIALPENRICPYYWVVFMINAIPAEGSQPALCYRSRGTLVPLTYQQLTKWLKEWVARAGCDPTEFSSHSMRRGGANFAFESDIPGQTIQLLGDWASQAYLRYLELSVDTRIDSMVILARAVNERLKKLK